MSVLCLTIDFLQQVRDQLDNGLQLADTLRWAASTGRFYFHKDTACATQPIQDKLAAVKDFPDFKFFNANAATLLFSLQRGAAGFSGTCFSCILSVLNGGRHCSELLSLCTCLAM